MKHVLCSECKKFLENQKKLNDKRSAQTKFMCIFCEENHNFNLIHLLKNNKERNESCCAVFWYIIIEYIISFLFLFSKTKYFF